MRPPEMSYSPAYHQGQDPLSAAARSSILPPLSCRSLEHTEPSHPGPRPSVDGTPYDVSPRSSGPRGSLTQSPEASRRASRADDDFNVTRVVVSGGVIYKEERSRGSWADQPSLMSVDHAGTPRTQKRDAIDVPAVDSQDALLMLFRLSLPVPIYSLGACLYACCALIFAVLISPLRLCPPTPYLRNMSFQSQLCDLLSPALHIHERLVRMRPPIPERSSSTQWIHADADTVHSSTPVDPTRDYAVGASILVLTLSPFFSIAILLCVWTAASFWVFAMVMGNPDGTERKDDGRAAVLGVCKWWHTWLGKARKWS